MVRRIVCGLALIVAGWFVFDGGRALVVGDYVTPSSGEHAGQLGLWAGVVAAVGIEPRSTTMKLIFVVYGVAWLSVIGAFLAGRSWAWTAMLAAAIGSLWYLPFGTLLGVVQVVLLLLPVARDAPG